MTTDQANTQASAQAYKADTRNDNVLVYVNGQFAPRNEARVSVFDSGFVLGDGVWEGLRLVKGRLISLDAHLDRLFEGARSIQLDIGLTREGVVKAVQDTLDRNGMTDGAHVRLMVTRGVKKTPNQDPRFVIGPATIVIVAEYKTPLPEAKAKGYALFTSTFRTTQPDQFDLRLNSHSRLNLIQALIQAIKAVPLNDVVSRAGNTMVGYSSDVLTMLGFAVSTTVLAIYLLVDPVRARGLVYAMVLLVVILLLPGGLIELPRVREAWATRRGWRKAPVSTAER